MPIHQSSTYAQDGVGGHRGFQYSRAANPTRSALEACLASLEGAAFGDAFASGVAAADAGVPVRVIGDACAGVSEQSHRAGLEVLALYAPLVGVVARAEL